MPDLRKPDASNYLKLIEDALTGVAWEDDAQVFDARAVKLLSNQPRTEVEIVFLPERGRKKGVARGGSASEMGAR